MKSAARANLVSTYLDEAGAHPLLDAQTERAQARTIVELRDAYRDAAVRDEDASTVESLRQRYLTARGRFLCSNLRLVVAIAKRYGRHRMSLADRIQEGNIGLLEAIDRFDPERGVRFSTYAVWWIRHTVIRALVKKGRVVRIPRQLHRIFTRVRRARSELRGDLGRDPSLAELSEHLDLPRDAIERAIEAMELRTVPLDHPAHGADGPSVGELLPDERLEGWSDRIGERIDSALADDVVDELDEMAFDVVVHRYGLRAEPVRTLRSLGEDYDLSRERIRQIQNEALRYLRSAIDGSDIASLAVAEAGSLG